MKKIAPRLTELVTRDRLVKLWDFHKEATRELRALLAVARAADRGMDDWFCGCDKLGCKTCALDSALIRLKGPAGNPRRSP